MKAISKISLLFQLDKLYDRIDLQRPTAHVLAFGSSLLWALLGSTNMGDFWKRLTVMIIFMLLLRLLLSRVGASRLSALVVFLVTLAFTRDFDVSEIMLLSTTALAVSFAQEFFILRNKYIAVGAAIFTGLLAATASGYQNQLFFVFVSVLIARFVWHAVIERMGRKAFFLMGIKVAGMLVITSAVWLVAKEHMSISLNVASSLPSVAVPLWVWVVGVAIIIRGIWATLLLKTERSPLHRALRLFYGFFGAGLLILVALMQQFAGRIFLPQVLDTISTWGLTNHGIVVASYAFLAAGLFLTAGMDRSLYKDAWIARHIKKLL